MVTRCASRRKLLQPEGRPASEHAGVRDELPGSGILLANITSTGTGTGRGFYSSMGSNPPGVTFVNDSFN